MTEKRAAGDERIRRIGAFIRERRRARRLTQGELALLAGVSRPFISNLERGKTSLRVVELDRVLRVFGKGISIDDLGPDERGVR